MEERTPAEVFPPGEFVRDELEERGWTQTDLAGILGRPVRVVNEVITGKRGVSPETASGLAQAFGTSAQYWLNLESAYQLSRAPKPDGGVARRARLYAKAPITQMVRRNWIEASSDVEVLERRVLDFLEIGSLDEEPAFWRHAARKSTSYETMTPAQYAWLFRARRLAGRVAAVSQGFSQERFQEAMEGLRGLLACAEEVGRIPRVLADAGIRLLVVEHLPQTRIDGACFWLDERSPVVVMSLRFDRIDYFWHTLMHELGHVKHRDGVSSSTLDIDLVGDAARIGDSRPEFERAADRFAVETLVPQDLLEGFIARVRPLYSKAKITRFAEQVGVHPGIVVGQLHHRGEISYAHNREMLVKVREIVTRATLTDGWGHVLEAA